MLLLAPLIRGNQPLKGFDPDRVYFKPLWPAGYRAKADGASWRRDSVLVIEPCDETQWPGWRFQDSEYQGAIDPETSSRVVPFQCIGVPGIHLDGKQCFMCATQFLHPPRCWLCCTCHPPPYDRECRGDGSC